MSLLIPINSTDAQFIQSVPLESVTYIFAFKYNVRTAVWYISLYDSNNNPLVINLKILPLLPLFSRHRTPAMFHGDIVGVNLNDQYTPPTRDNLGTDFNLYYFTNQEIVNNGIDMIA